MKFTKLLPLLALCFIFLSNGCNEENEKLETEQNCDLPKCYITQSISTYRGENEGEGVIWQYKMLNGEKVVDKVLYSQGTYNEILYDVNNRSIGTKYYSDGNLTSNSVITYNTNGQRATVLYTRNQDEDKWIFEYDSENRLKNYKYYYNGNLSDETVVQEYNVFGQPTLFFRYGDSRELTETIKYVYDCNVTNEKYISDNILEIVGHDFLDIIFPNCTSGCRLNELIFLNRENTGHYPIKCVS